MIKVLAIEDSETDRQVLKKALENCSLSSRLIIKYVYDVDDESNINYYDLIITDLKLNKTQGAETVEKIREKTNAPILIISGSYLSKENEMAMLAAAVNKSTCRYVRKGTSWTTKIGDYIKDMLLENIYKQQAMHYINIITHESIR